MPRRYRRGRALADPAATVATPPPPSTGADAHRVAPFGVPSSYSLSAADLARHVRQLRRAGWQPWEINYRFDFERRAA